MLGDGKQPLRAESTRKIATVSTPGNSRVGELAPRMLRLRDWESAARGQCQRDHQRRPRCSLALPRTASDVAAIASGSFTASDPATAPRLHTSRKASTTAGSYIVDDRASMIAKASSAGRARR